jgi:hypothetical protein
VETELTRSRHALEIACDESGWDGSNLVTGSSDVIAYASVRLDVDAARELIDESASAPTASRPARRRTFAPAAKPRPATLARLRDSKPVP